MDGEGGEEGTKEHLCRGDNIFVIIMRQTLYDDEGKTERTASL